LLVVGIGIVAVVGIGIVAVVQLVVDVAVDYS
jgi:hypothetical protein